MRSLSALRTQGSPALARCAPFVLFMTALALDSVFDLPWLVLARGAIVALALFWFWPNYQELRRPSSVHAAHWLLAVAAGVGVFLAWITFDQDWAVLSRSPGFDPRVAGGGIDWLSLLARLAGFALVVPLMEELFWRSLVLRWIAQHDFLAFDPRRAGLRAFAITTLLFALEHERWFAGAVAGMVYNGLYMRSGNLWVPIVAHAVTNGVLGLWILSTNNWQFW